MAKLICTGHRPQSLPGGFKNKALHRRIKNKIKQVLAVKKPELVISGMALGFDQWLAEVAVELNIPFIAALPCKGQERKWPSKSQEHYKWLLSKAHKIVYVDREIGYISRTVPPDVYHPEKMIRRNEWMVDQLISQDFVLSLYIPMKKSGTAHTLNYANNRVVEHLNFININPDQNCLMSYTSNPPYTG